MLCVTVAVLQEAGLFFFLKLFDRGAAGVGPGVSQAVQNVVSTASFFNSPFSFFFSFFFFELMLLPSCVSESFVWIQSKGISGGELSRFWIKLCAWMDAVFNGVICICRCSDRYSR